MPTKTRVALAGFGAWGQMQAKAIADIEGAEVVAVYCHGEASDQAAQRLLPLVRRFHDYEGMLVSGGFDVVCITVPNDQHAAFAVEALKSSFHVVLEKPLGLSLAECDQVIAAAQDNGRLVALDHE